MRPTEQTGTSQRDAALPRWNEVLRALREARGVTLDGWGAHLGVSRRTVQRWERGERAPDPGAEAAIIAYCRETGLFRRYERGPLAGLTLSTELLQDLLTEARWRTSEVPPGAPSGEPSIGGTGTVPPTVPVVSSSNLPAQLTSFIGREREIVDVRRVQAGTRLLTLTGAGGCGKTRLALELAGQLLWAYPHGVWLVDLAPLTDPVLLPQAVAAALQIHATGQRPLIETLTDVLERRHLLLILDNCEHLLPACAVLVETLLRACPYLEIVATSRESLGIGGETVWHVPPMALPPVTGQPAIGSRQSEDPAGTQSSVLGPQSFDAVRLFTERAGLQRLDLELTPSEETAVAAICRRLDGMPLAIELAAARVKVLSVAQIAERLDDRFRLLTGGGRTAVPRHQTLRAAMDWSHDLLTDEERVLFRRLSVFAGGFTLEAAEAVGADAPDILVLLAALVDKSLVIAEPHDEAVRYRMLETLRRYAFEKLDNEAEAAAVRDRHRAWCLALAEAAEPELCGPRAVEWLARLEREHDNLRAALAWSLAGVPGRSPQSVSAHDGAGWGRPGSPIPKALRLASALTRFWEVRGHANEGRRWLADLLAADGATDTAARACALCDAGTLAHVQGDFAMADALFHESLLLYRELEDDDGVARAEVNLGWLAIRRGEYAIARTLVEAGLARSAEHGIKPIMATARAILGGLALRQGEYERAGACLEASLEIQRELGNKHGIAGILDDLATLAGELGDEERQAAALAESLALFRELGHKSGIAMALSGYGMMAWLRGEHHRASVLLQESLELYREVGERASIARLLGYQSVVALFRRDYAQAEALSRECLTLYREAGDLWAIGRYLPVLAGAMLGQGRAERAASLFAAAAAARERLGAPLPRALRSSHDRTVAALRGTLGDPAFTAAWRAGEAMPLQDALSDGLSGTAPA